MNKDYLLKFTIKTYRLTLFFPKKEPLRYKLRELADNILSDFTYLSHIHSSKKLTQLESNIEVFFHFLEIAKIQNWVSSSDILNIQEDCSRMKRSLEMIKGVHTQEEFVEKETEVEVPEPQLVSLDSKKEFRQKKILEILKEKGKSQVGEIKEYFPEVTKRTLRRDFEYLLLKELIERIGEKNNTFYQIKSA